MTSSHSMVTLDRSGNRPASKILLSSLLLSLLLGLNASAEQEIRLDLEENGGLFLPEGFEAEALVNRLDGQVRHIA
ncbi:MAG TPA: hypothetical protein EYO94_09610, partial [Acidobacteria bacterium]|nr:hypothetical protein [Acidobacteriota bacterium]